eukprot:7286834-Pyramimonas_sp.AAC.1
MHAIFSQWFGGGLAFEVGRAALRPWTVEGIGVACSLGLDVETWIPLASRGARPENVQSSLCGASWELLCGSVLGVSRGLFCTGFLRGLWGPLGGVLGRREALLRRVAHSEAGLGAFRGRIG